MTKYLFLIFTLFASSSIAENIVDPTRPLEPTQSAKNNTNPQDDNTLVRLEGIRYSNEKKLRLVIVNNSTYHTGETIGDTGWSVISIQADKATLRNNKTNETTTLTLN